VKWNPAQVKDYYGVVVLNHISEPYDPREVAPDAFRASKVPIQVFSLNDVVELLRVVDTIYDFIVYYEMRAAYANRFRVPVHEESSTYSGILADYRSLLPAQYSPGSFLRNQRFQESITRAALRARNVRKNDIERLAASYLIDLTLGSTAERAQAGKGGKPVGSSEHEFLVAGMAAIGEMSRLRRSVWGARWVSVAGNARRNKNSRHTMGHSPKRNRAYVVSATNDVGPYREELAAELTSRALRELQTSSVLCLIASPMRILWTYDYLKRVIKGVDRDPLPKERVLDSTLVWAMR
jgi:hypothetical protein